MGHMPEEASNTSKKDGKVPSSVEVKKQTVAGFIIFRRTPEGTKFLMLYRRGSYWNFPKGKFEEGENEFKAALREAVEETGIKESELRIVPNFRTHLNYNFRIGNERIYDTVVLYLAETKKAEVTIVPREHSGFAWFLYPDALKILGNKYVGTKKILKQANDFLRKMNGERNGPPQGRNHKRNRSRGRRGNNPNQNAQDSKKSA
jgi:8-oxo-dGTP pyrophosphatase MutT (NUDIX family)